MLSAGIYPLALRLALLALLSQSGLAFLSSKSSPLSPPYYQNENLARRRMFTGVVEEIGTIRAFEERDDIVMWDGSTGKGTVMTVEAGVVINGVYPGCRICVSGVGVTAIEIQSKENLFVGLVPPESLRSTYLGCLAVGDRVNLERPSEISGRSSGHFVQGNVDSWGEVVEREEDGDLLLLKVKVAPELLKFIVPRGFVAIDGSSLTVCQVNQSECWFSVAPSATSTVLQKDAGDPVNVEVDVMGKYSENAVATLLPRLQELENKYRKLQTKTSRLEAINEELEQKIQSLENVRLLDNGAHSFIPQAKMVGGPEARKANEDWIRQRAGKNEQWATPERKKAKGANSGQQREVVGGAEARKANEDWIRQRAVKNEPWPSQEKKQGKGHAHVQQREMVRGREAQEVNNEWLRQQNMRKDDWLRRQDMAGQQNLKIGVDVAGKPNAADVRPRQQESMSAAQVVGGEEAHRVNNDWLRQQRQKNEEWARQQNHEQATHQSQDRRPEKFSVSGPEAQRINDEWRRQKAREQERFSRVKRVHEDESGPDEGAAHDGFQRPRKFKTMVAGRHAKKINDEWLQQTGKDLYEEVLEDPGMKIQDATVVNREAGSEAPGSEWRHVVENDQDAFGRREKKHPFMNQRPGHNLDIQDATLVDNDFNDRFLLNQFEAKGSDGDENESSNDDAGAGNTPQDLYFATKQQTNHQEDLLDERGHGESPYGEMPGGAFNDGWFDRSGGNPDDAFSAGLENHEDATSPRNEGHDPLKGIQPDPGLHVTGLNPDQQGNSWGGRLF